MEPARRRRANVHGGRDGAPGERKVHRAIVRCADREGFALGSKASCRTSEGMRAGVEQGARRVKECAREVERCARGVEDRARWVERDRAAGSDGGWCRLLADRARYLRHDRGGAADVDLGAQGDAALVYGGGTASTFDNSGTLRKSAGAGKLGQGQADTHMEKPQPHPRHRPDSRKLTRQASRRHIAPH